MNEIRNSEMRLDGIDLLKIIHIVLQIVFIPVAAGCLEHNFQILIPLPVGIFIILSIIANFLVFIPHLIENRHNLNFSITQTELTIRKTRFRKNLSITHYIPKTTITSGQIHESLGWSIVYMLGFGWNFYLISEGAKLLSVKAFFQGLPMFFYGLITGIMYLLMWFLPEREFALMNNEDNKKSMVLLIPYTYISFKMRRILLGKKWFSEIGSSLKSKRDTESRSMKSFLKENKILIFQLCTWLAVWLLGSPFTFDFYHYQFVATFVFIILISNIRSLFFRTEGIHKNSWWVYPFWILTFHEVGIKTWHLTALGVLSPSTIIWTLPISWILYVLVLISTVLEILRNFTKKSPKNIKLIVISTVLLLDLGLQITAFFSTFKIIPIFLSLIEIGPIF